ncbi:MAG: FAD-dependent oxidoreductase [Betaproteobacteria bacterium]|nr:FAD-dependent oxidoreductase [Betaproteobacteria bacterium]
MNVDTDIAIIGGGPVGAALALALRDSDFSVTVLEARAAAGSDPRPLALAHGSRLTLERMGAWAALRPTPINHIHVSQRGGFGRVAMHADEVGVPALGYVADYGAVQAALTKAVREQAARCVYREGARATAIHHDGEVNRIEYTLDGIPATLAARLTVVADGGDIDGLAPPKVVDYGQCALTARVRTRLAHQDTAYERFTAQGPLALLPFGDEMALVWTLTPAPAEVLKDVDDQGFLAALREAFGARLGDFTQVEQRACYALSLRTASPGQKPGIVTIGNAAQTLHPVAGQGFNLGLRDAWELAHLLRASAPNLIAAPDTLRRFSARRRADRYATIAATHGLVRLFSNDFFAASALRGAGMALLGSIAPARDFLARRMIHGVRI